MADKVYVTDFVVEEISESGEYALVFWDDIEYTFSVIDASRIAPDLLRDKLFGRINVRTTDGKISRYLGTVFAVGGKCNNVT